MRKILLFLMMLLTVGVSAQQTGFTEVKNVEQFKKEFATQNAKLTSIRSSFVQEKTLAMLTEKIVSKGEFWFKRNDKIRIEYKTPYTYLLIINGDQMITKDNQKESHINTSSNKLFKQVNRIIIDCVQGTILNNADFSVKVFQSATHYRLQLTPQAKAIKEFFQTITITLDKKDYTVADLELVEQGGDSTLMQFSNKQLNTSLDDAIFTLQ